MAARLEGKAAIVTGAGRGLGRSMALALARAGAGVVAAAHIAEDLETLAAEDAGPGRLVPVLADIRDAADCRRIVAAALDELGGLDLLVNNAGLTFTYIYPGRFLREAPPKFWECSDDAVQAVMDTNYVAHDRMTRLAVPHMIAQGRGRIVNVTTMIETMSRAGASPYGPSKAALEMASEVWMKDLAGTGVSVVILNPGGAADTEGFASAEEKRRLAGRIAMVAPDRMAAPIVWLASDESAGVNGLRFDAADWDPDRPAAAEAARIGRPLGLTLKPRGTPPPDN